MVEKACKIYTPVEVAKHSKGPTLWVSYKGGVYDVTDFLPDHPGGDEFIREYAGADITEILADPISHTHSEGAYEVLEEYRIGNLSDAAPTTTTTTTTAVTDTSAMEPLLDIKEEADKVVFLDLEKPLFPQMWRANFSLATYLEEVHKPRHLSRPATLMPHPSLEFLSMTPWWVVPLVWIPISWTFYRWAEADLGARLALSWYLFGILFWTFVEYILHRFVFHIDEYLPDHPIFMFLHFSLHGVHHFLPMDRMRLVMPPALAILIAIPLYSLFICSLFPLHIARAVFAGLLIGFLAYDLTHYYLHHGRPYTGHIRSMKTHHIAHHYKDFHSGFGVSQKWWDHVFNTVEA